MTLPTVDHPKVELAIERKAQVICEALEELKPGKPRLEEELFAASYVFIQAALDRKVTQKAILAVLAEQGLKLHPSRFRKLLEAERQKALDSAAKASGADDMPDTADNNIMQTQFPPSV